VILGGAFLVNYDLSYQPKEGLTALSGGYIQLITKPGPMPKERVPFWAIIFLCTIVGVSVIVCIGLYVC
jgi:hypothetical protein